MCSPDFVDKNPKNGHHDPEKWVVYKALLKKPHCVLTRQARIFHNSSFYTVLFAAVGKLAINSKIKRVLGTVGIANKAKFLLRTFI